MWFRRQFLAWRGVHSGGAECIGLVILWVHDWLETHRFLLWWKTKLCSHLAYYGGIIMFRHCVWDDCFGHRPPSCPWPRPTYNLEAVSLHHSCHHGADCTTAPVFFRHHCPSQVLRRRPFTLPTSSFLGQASLGIGTVSISGPRAALQRRRQKCGSLTGRVGYRFLSPVHRPVHH